MKQWWRRYNLQNALPMSCFCYYWRCWKNSSEDWAMDDPFCFDLFLSPSVKDTEGDSTQQGQSSCPRIFPLRSNILGDKRRSPESTFGKYFFSISVRDWEWKQNRWEKIPRVDSKYIFHWQILFYKTWTSHFTALLFSPAISNLAEMIQRLQSFWRNNSGFFLPWGIEMWEGRERRSSKKKEKSWWFQETTIRIFLFEHSVKNEIVL